MGGSEVYRVMVDDYLGLSFSDRQILGLTQGWGPAADRGACDGLA